LKVLKSLGTSIILRIAGGKLGKYDLVVVHQYYGASYAINNPADDDFEFMLKVNSVAPLQLSKGGGTLLTIDGENFDPTETAMLVNIGEEVN
jgi:hypothetical protein